MKSIWYYSVLQMCSAVSTENFVFLTPHMHRFNRSSH